MGASTEVKHAGCQILSARGPNSHDAGWTESWWSRGAPDLGSVWHIFAIYQFCNKLLIENHNV